MNERQRKEMLSDLYLFTINSRKVFCNEMNIMHIPKERCYPKITYSSWVVEL